MNAALNVTLYIFSALAGLAVGSFLNVCIYRLPRGEFFSRSRSYCPKCGAQIKAYDNIPLFSYIVLRGRCRNCKERISPRYPLVELLTCALWVGNYAAFGMDGLTLVWDIAVSVLIVAAFVDLDTFEIPDSGIVVLLILGLVTFAPFGGVSWQDKLIGCVCVSVPMLIVCLFGGMGFGDVKLYFVLGLLLGWKKILLVFLVSAVLGAVVSVAVLVKKRAGKRGKNITETGDGDAELAEHTNGSESLGESARHYESKDDDNATSESNEDDGEESDVVPGKKGHEIPFGPFIAIATLVALYGGDAVISMYARILGL